MWLWKLSDPSIVLDSWRSSLTYAYANAGSIFVYMEQAITFEIKGVTNGASYMNTCTNN